MAKKRKKKAAPPAQSGGGINKQVLRQSGALAGGLLYLFVLLSLLDQAGKAGGELHAFAYSLIGVMTPVLVLPLLWLGARRFLPKFLPPKAMTVGGLVLLGISLTGISSSVVSPEAGGLLGRGLAGGLSGLLGVLLGRLVLFALAFIGISLIIDRGVLFFLRTNEPSLPEHEGEEEEDEEPAYARVPATAMVAGELGTNRFARFGKALGKPTTISVEQPKPKGGLTMPVHRSANWSYPPLALLDATESRPVPGDIKKNMEAIDKALGDFGIDVTMTDVKVGPTVSQYQLRPADGVRLNQITARQDDLALALSAQSLRVEAPIPGKGLVGVEVPNEKKAVVGVREVLKTKAFKELGAKLGIVLGRDAAGDPAFADLAKMPHCLVAGSTGSGKSVCINSMILSLLVNNSPDELRMILVDPKRVELTGYNGLPHLLSPVITEPRDTVIALKRMVEEMERRYKLLQRLGKRNIEQYNQAPDLAEGRLPYIVIIIDELADLMMVSAKEVEQKIVRLAQMARAVGIHLIVATQRPSVDVITGLIKANIPTRIAFAVTSQIDSRTILDSAGAEKLLGYGDMLYVSTDVLKPKRIQGAFCSETDINNVIAHIKAQEGDRYDPSFLEDAPESRFGGGGGGLDDEEEELVKQAYDLFVKHNKASTSMLQTYLRLGYNKAKRIVAACEDRGLIGPERGGKQREVYARAMDEQVPVVEMQGVAGFGPEE